MARFHIQFAWPFCVLLLELSAPYDLFISYDWHLLELPYVLGLLSPLEVYHVFFIMVSPYVSHLDPPFEVSQVLLSVFTPGIGARFCCCLVGYLCVTCAHACSGLFSISLRLPLCLFVDYFSANLGMTLNSSTKFLSTV